MTSPIKLFMLTMLMLFIRSSNADDKIFTFNAVNQRSVSLTAQYWNPILKYVSEKSGVQLELKLTKTALESSAMAGKGAFDFIYTHHLFTPTNAAAGYRVFVQPVSTVIKGQIVVLANSPIHSLEQLQDKPVAFASTAAFTGYAVPMNAFLRAQIKVIPDFAGNQEGAMAQLKAGKVLAAGVNSEVMRDYAEREIFKYRVLWESDSYRNVPIAALPSVSTEKVKAVQEAFVKMDADPVGHKILMNSAAIIKLDPPYGFIPATDKDYANFREFYKTNLIKDFK